MQQPSCVVASSEIDVVGTDVKLLPGDPMRLSLLISGLACLALVGCAKPPPTVEQVHAHLTETINRVIKDPARAQQVSGLAGKLLDQQQSMAGDLTSTVDQFAALNTDYTASNDQYTALYSDYQSKRKAAQMKFKDDIFALRKEVSAEEWKEIIK